MKQISKNSMFLQHHRSDSSDVIQTKRSCCLMDQMYHCGTIQECQPVSVFPTVYSFLESCSPNEIDDGI